MLSRLVSPAGGTMSVDQHNNAFFVSYIKLLKSALPFSGHGVKLKCFRL